MTGAMQGRLGYLDGLRGLAAAWVIAGHACILTGFHLPLVQSPNFAVDLFMLISGFLMYYQASVRSNREPFEAPSSWGYFWTRRLFRLSPVYYLALFFALAFGSQLGEYRDAIASVFPGTATPTSRYADHSWQNIVTHVTYIFGFSPTYSYRTALPDWSIGLEMQFYLVFPALFVLMKRFGAILTSVMCIGTAIAAWLFEPALMSSFEMPTFLPLKINLFLSGMLMGACIQKSNRMLLYFSLGIVVASIPLDGNHSLNASVLRMVFAAGIGGLACYDKIRLPDWSIAVFDWASSTLGNRFFFWMGELSYSAYLIHLLVMLPVAATIDHLGLNQPWLRFSLCLLIVSALTYSASWVILLIVERPGRTLGRTLIQRIKRSAQPVTASV
jgi:peptidoglycan/LPS O-acetylase OafA/YrhL